MQVFRVLFNLFHSADRHSPYWIASALLSFISHSQTHPRLHFVGILYVLIRCFDSELPLIRHRGCGADLCRLACCSAFPRDWLLTRFDWLVSGYFIITIGQYGASSFFILSPFKIECIFSAEIALL